MKKHLALVVGRPPGKKLPAPLDRGEGVNVPLPQRLHGLDVVIAIYQNGWRGWIHAMTLIREPLSGPCDVRMVGRVGRNGRDCQPVLERGEELGSVRLDVIPHIHESAHAS